MRIISKFGINLHRITEKNKVIELLNSLHPIQTQYKLIRLGPNTDGGYLVPDDLENIEACFSPGVDVVSDFELDCLKYNMKIFMADKSVEKPNFNLSEDKYEFIKKFIGCTNNEDEITMDTWVESSDLLETSDLMLQMDIENSEYISLINMSDKLIQRFRIMVIEFHNLHQLWDPMFFHFAQKTFNKISQTHYCVHIHPNNCCGVYTQLGIEIPRVAEFTFIRKSNAENLGYVTQFPHELDYDNTSNKSINLSKNFFKHN